LKLQDGSDLAYGCLVWATGNAPTDFAKSLPFERDAQGRILIRDDLSVAGAEGVYALGDCAAVANHLIPATAQAAEQQGYYLARSLAMRLVGKTSPPFRYNNQGMLAYIGGHSGVVDLNHFKGRGFLAFVFWRSVYLTKLVSLRNKATVLIDWLRTFIFGREISRL
jgi:NADH:ubiquinone reductase (non-electrogenic)